MSVSDIVEMLKTVIILSLPVVEYLGFKKFNDSYMEEKGKNLATKEDVQELTVLAEDIKIMYQSKQYRDEHIYDIKLSAIQESLEFLDDYDDMDEDLDENDPVFQEPEDEPEENDFDMTLEQAMALFKATQQDLDERNSLYDEDDDY